MVYTDGQKKSFELSYAFPLNVYNTWLKDNVHGTISWHYHEELQITYVLEGTICVAFHDESYTLGAGEAIFINSNLSHTIRSDDPETAHYLTLNFQPSILTLYHGSILEQKYFLPYIKDPKMQVATFSPKILGEKSFLDGMRALFSAAEKKEFGYELIVYSILIGLWKFLIDNIGDYKRRAQDTENSDARQLLLYLQENYAEHITLEELAGQVHISKSACCRLFNNVYGCTPFSYLTDYRLQMSIRLLADPTLSVAQIAQRCGFKSTSYFIKTFREKIGTTPLQYRRSCR